MGHPRRRARALLVAVAVVFSVLAVQLFRIQAVDPAGMSAAALDARIRRVTIPAQRGQVVDAQGVVLADSVDRRNVVADPQAMAEYRRKVGSERVKVGVDGALADLAAVLGLPREDLRATVDRALARNPRTRFLYLAKDVAPSRWREVQALGVPGVTSEHVVKRQYPQGTSVAPLIGWVGSNGEPGGGIEQMMNPDLQGRPGLSVYERSGDGSPIATGDSQLQPAVPGRGVRLTIDNDIQWYAQNALAQQVQATGAVSGDVVVLEVRTGRVLAAASYPSFDNNSMGSAKGYLQLRPFTEVYEPGSTSKVVTMAAALDKGYVTPTTQVRVPGQLVRSGRPFRDSEEHGTLDLTAAGVLAKSSNIGTVLVGERMPPTLVHDYLRRFGLGSTTGVGFPGESRGILAPAERWKADQRYTVLFGQGLASTAVQQASVFQALANGGERLPVTLVDGVADGHGGYVRPRDDRRPQRVVKAETASQLNRMMQSVTTQEGTAQQAAVPGYQVAGKTSTAQRYDAQLRRYSGTTASFIGFAPAAKPDLVVAVTVQKPARGTYGGVVAGPVFSRIMSFALQHRKVPPAGGGPAPYPLTVGTIPAPSAAREQQQ